jgi:hypothetical protein
MEIVGFIALIVVGLYLAVAGFGGAFAAYGFSGKMLWPVIIIGCIGLFVLYQAYEHAPFTISAKH